MGLESRLSKLLLARSSVGVVCALDDGRSNGDLEGASPLTDLPSSERWSSSCSGSRDLRLDDLCTAEVSMVIVGARGRRAGPGEGDALPPGGGAGWSSDMMGSLAVLRVSTPSSAAGPSMQVALLWL